VDEKLELLIYINMMKQRLLPSRKVEEGEKF